jgi:hypothetical protein
VSRTVVAVTALVDEPVGRRGETDEDAVGE